MSEVERIVITSCSTVVVGVFVLVAGQILTKFFIEPIHEQFRVIGEIADSLVFYANVYSNPGTAPRENMDEASMKLRQQASRLRARTSAVRWYGLWEKLRVVRRRGNIVEAAGNLIGLSNCIHQSVGNGRENGRRRDAIMSMLGIEGE